MAEPRDGPSRRDLLNYVALGTASIAGAAGVYEYLVRPDGEAGSNGASETPSGEPGTSEITTEESVDGTAHRTAEREDVETYPGVDSLPNPMEVDASNPFVYLNDQSTDNYMGELALAMADSGTVSLRAFILGYPREVWKKESKYQSHREEYVRNHRKMYQKAVESGFERLPEPTLGVFEQHQKPPSGRIQDTETIGSDGTEAIVSAARSASPDSPVVIAAGGDLCTVADAYLMDPSIADSLVVYWHEQVADINDQSGYNIQNSGWSAAVVLNRLAVVLDHSSGGFTITQAEVTDRIPSPLDTYMQEKEHWKWGNPLRSDTWSDRGEHDGSDEKALLLGVFPDTRSKTGTVSVSGIQSAEWDYPSDQVLPVVETGTGDSHLYEAYELTDMRRAFWDSWS